MNLSAFIVPTCPENGKILLGRKADGLWSFFGGNMDKKDLSPAITALREFFEETGLAILSISYSGDYMDSDEKRIFIFESDINDTAEIKLSPEHTEHRWVTMKEANRLKMRPRAKRIFKTIKAWGI